MAMVSGSGRNFGGVFSGIKSFFGDLMGNDESVLGENEYLEGSENEELEFSAEPVTAVAAKDDFFGTDFINETAVEMKTEEIMSEAEAPDVSATEVKSEPVFARSTIIKPADFFSGEVVASGNRSFSGGRDMVSAKVDSAPAYDAPGQTTERVGSAGVGFNYSNHMGEANGATAGRSFTAQKSGSSAGTMVQFFEPRDTKQADDICTVLKAGHIVVVNLCHIREESDKLRIIDFVAGCCKGIDAKAQTIAPKSIFIAAPKGVELRKAVDYSAEQNAEAASGTSPFFGGINFNAASGGERSTNAFNPRF